LKVLVPFTLGFRGIQPGADQQQDDVFRRGLQDLLEYLAAIAEFAGGQVNLDPAFFRKQRHGVAFVCYGVPVELVICVVGEAVLVTGDRKSTRLNSSHVKISYAVFCLKKKKIVREEHIAQNTAT